MSLAVLLLSLRSVAARSAVVQPSPHQPAGPRGAADPVAAGPRGAAAGAAGARGATAAVAAGPRNAAASVAAGSRGAAAVAAAGLRGAAAVAAGPRGAASAAGSTAPAAAGVASGSQLPTLRISVVRVCQPVHPPAAAPTRGRSSNASSAFVQVGVAVTYAGSFILQHLQHVSKGFFKGPNAL